METQINDSFQYIPFFIQLLHMCIPFIYVGSILFASDLYTLFLIMIGNFILLQFFDYFKICILSKYEDINEKYISSMSFTLCSMVSSEETCKSNRNLEREFIHVPIMLAFIKFVYIVLVQDWTGTTYTSDFVLVTNQISN